MRTVYEFVLYFDDGTTICMEGVRETCEWLKDKWTVGFHTYYESTELDVAERLLIDYPEAYECVFDRDPAAIVRRDGTTQGVVK